MAREIKINVDGIDRAGTVSPNNPLTVGSLTNDQPNDIKIKVVDDGVESGYSNAVSVTPNSPAGVVYPPAPPPLPSKLIGMWGTKDDWSNINDMNLTMTWGLGPSASYDMVHDPTYSAVNNAPTIFGNVFQKLGDGTNGTETLATWRNRLQNIKPQAEAIGESNLLCINLQDEPITKHHAEYLGNGQYNYWTVEEMELLVEEAQKIVNGNGQNQFRFSYTMTFGNTLSNTSSYITSLPQNVDYIGFNYYPFGSVEYWYSENGFKNQFDQSMNYLRSLASPRTRFFLVAQGFQGGGMIDNTPVDSPSWYMDKLSQYSDVDWLLYWKYSAGSPYNTLDDLPTLWQNVQDAYANFNG